MQLSEPVTEISRSPSEAKSSLLIDGQRKERKRVNRILWNFTVGNVAVSQSHEIRRNRGIPKRKKPSLLSSCRSKTFPAAFGDQRDLLLRSGDEELYDF